jgi:hypothetical protein
MPEVKLYIGSKLIKAHPMDETSFLNEHREKTISKDAPTREGYVVFYPDGYVSWSPKDAFETAYREVTDGERDLIES